jgi:hypothetical protein
MEDRQCKLRKLDAMRRRMPHMSVSAMSALMREVKKRGLPEVHLGRKVFREARDLETAEVTPLGPLLHPVIVMDKQNEETQIVIGHPLAMLWKAVHVGSQFSKYFQERLNHKPSSSSDPWSLLLYSDEVTPGDPLAAINLRRFHAVYWSFLELGLESLSHEEAWFIALTEYSSDVNKISAGLSQVMSAILKVFFSHDGTNIQTTGILLVFSDGSTTRFWAKLAGLIQDGGAQKSTFHSRGDGASKFCLICKNLFTKSSQIVDEDGSNLLTCGVVKASELATATSHEIRTNARYLAKKAAVLAPSGEQFISLQQALGLTHHNHSLLLDRQLDPYIDPCSAYIHDPMHGLFVDGVFNILVYLLFEHMIQQGYLDIYEIFSNYVEKWNFPVRLKQTGAGLAKIFSKDRRDKHRSAKHIKCQASDGLSLVQVAAMFTVRVLMMLGVSCRAECLCFLALVDVIDLIFTTPHGMVSPAELLEAVELFLAMFKKLWGVEWMTPKFHWLLHYSSHLARLGYLLNCFCLERKHKVAKRYASDLTNTYWRHGKSLLKEVLCQHFHQLDDPYSFSFGIGLLDARKPSKRVKALLATGMELSAEDADSIQWSNESRFSRMATCRQGDMILFRDADGAANAGKVQLHFSVQEVAITMIESMNLHKANPNGYSVFNGLGTSEFVITETILDTVVWSELPDSKFAVLIPLYLRS